MTDFLSDAFGWIDSALVSAAAAMFVVTLLTQRVLRIWPSAYGMKKVRAAVALLPAGLAFVFALSPTFLPGATYGIRLRMGLAAALGVLWLYEAGGVKYLVRRFSSGDAPADPQS